MCDYCNKENNVEDLAGSDGIIFENGKYYLFIEHFYNEKYMIEAAYCPRCGVKL